MSFPISVQGTVSCLVVFSGLFHFAVHHSRISDAMQLACLTWTSHIPSMAFLLIVFLLLSFTLFFSLFLFFISDNT